MKGARGDLQWQAHGNASLNLVTASRKGQSMGRAPGDWQPGSDRDTKERVRKLKTHQNVSKTKKE